MKIRNFSFITCCLLGAFLPTSLQAKVVEQAKLDFPVQWSQISKGDIHVYYYLSEKGTPSDLRKKDPTYARVSQAMGSVDRSHDSLYAMIVRTVYSVGRPMDRYVRAELLNNLDYLQFVLDTKLIRRLSSTQFEVDRRGNTPGFRMDRDLVVSKAQIEKIYSARLEDLPFKTLEGEIPFLVQDSDQFSKIMGQNTSKDARLISAHFEEGENAFRVDAYTISHLYNVPPGFVGGTRRLKEDVLKGIEKSVVRIQAYKP